MVLERHTALYTVVCDHDDDDDDGGLHRHNRANVVLPTLSRNRRCILTRTNNR